MKKIVFITFIGCIFYSCGENNKNSSNQSTNDSNKIAIQESAKNLQNKSVRDSLDAANNIVISENGKNINYAYVDLKDSSFHLTANMKLDHRIFGYKNPVLQSERVILFSIFTNDVENNPFGCKLGSYYDTNGLEDYTIKYSETNGDFIKVYATDKFNHQETFFIDKKWVIIQ